MQQYEKPSEWCDRMIREAKNGEEAMAHFELKKLWESRGQ